MKHLPCTTLGMAAKANEAHLLNIQAISLEPDNLNYSRLNAAAVLMNEHRYTDAVAVLRRPIASPKHRTRLPPSKPGSTRSSNTMPQWSGRGNPSRPLEPKPSLPSLQIPAPSR